MFMKLFISVLLTVGIVASSHHSNPHSASSRKCDCLCPENEEDGRSMCEKMSLYEKEFSFAKAEIERRTRYINEISDLRERMELQEDLVAKLQLQIEELKKKNIENEILPSAMPFVMRPEDQMLGDSNRETRMSEDDRELFKNVTNLLAKVEVVESITTQVQEELKSERRVRRHLEEDLNQTRSSIQNLDDKLQNVTFPMDTRMAHVEEVIFTTLENMNKTLFEEHLPKLYYKVDGVVYRNETKKLDERLDHIETELLEANATSTMLKLSDELKTLKKNFLNLSTSVSEIVDMNSESTRTVESSGTDDDFSILLNATALIQSGVTELWQELQDIRNYTSHVEKRMRNLYDERMEFTDNVTQELLQKFDVMSTDIVTLKLQISMDEKSIDNLQKVLQLLDADATITANRVAEMDHLMEKKVQDYTSHVEQKLHNFHDERMNSTENMTQELFQKSEIMSTDVLTLNSRILRGEELFNNLEKEVQLLAADVAVMENHVLELNTLSEKRLEDIFSKIDNITDQWDNSLSAIASHIIELKDTNQDKSDIYYTTEGTMDEPSTFDDKLDEEVSARTRAKGINGSLCTLPEINDPHTLVSIDTGTDGQQQLIFGCQPIGQYAMSGSSAPMRCENGQWSHFPTCVRLLNEVEMADIANEIEYFNPCMNQSPPSYEEVGDSTDCSYFFSCSNGRVIERTRCPPGLYFSQFFRRCDSSHTITCHPDFSKEAQKLKNITPTILIEPNIVDKPQSMMGTGETGELIVFPRTNIRLHCLFPDSIWGPPSWSAEFFSQDANKIVRGYKSGKGRFTLYLSVASRNDSGIYKCISPFGTQHSITIIVEAVTCPAIDSSSRMQSNIYYNPHPEVGYRVLSTSVEFPCERGHTITSICRADGKWSRSAPTEEECPQERSHWGCPSIDTMSEPDLILERDEEEMSIVFKCAGMTRLVGQTYTRCYRGKWSHIHLPKCIVRTF